MQRINHYFDVLERELVRREESSGNGNVQGTKEKKVGQQSYTTGQPAAPDAQQRWQSSAFQKEQQKHHRQRRQEMEREMRREWKESIREMEEFKEQRRNLRRSNRRLSMQENLDSAWGRDHAHALYLSAVEAWQQQTKHPLQTEKVIAKPRNALMEYCNEEAVVAMRLGKSNVAIEIVHEELVKAGEEWLYYKMRSSPSSYGQGRSIKLDQSYYRCMRRVLNRPLDEEKNSILHYAVYLEEHDMISFLTLTARRYHFLPKLVLYRSSRGLNAEDYALGSSKQSDVPKMIQDLTKEARKSVEVEPLDVKLRRAVEQSLPQHCKDFAPFAKTLACTVFGRYVMGQWWLLSIFIAVISLSELSNHPIQMKQQYEGKVLSNFVALHIQWILICKGTAQFWKLSDALLDASIPRTLQLLLLAFFAFFVAPAKEMSRMSSIAITPIPFLDQLVLDIVSYASMLVRRMKTTLHLWRTPGENNRSD